MVDTARRLSRAAAGACSSSASAAAPANCSHAVNDFRKIAGIEAYAPTDNVSELTARTNDEGWDTVFVGVAEGQPAAARGHAVFVFSVGGGSLEKNVSPNLVPRAPVRQDGGRARSSAWSGATAATRRRSPTRASSCPTVNPDTITPHTEAFQAVVGTCSFRIRR